MESRGIDVPNACWSQLMVAYSKAQDFEGCQQLLHRIAAKCTPEVAPVLDLRGRDALISPFVDRQDTVTPILPNPNNTQTSHLEHAPALL